MTFEVNRRTFLKALIAAGASYDLPTKATPAQVDELWAQVQANPWYFEVNELGTLVEAALPQIWADNASAERLGLPFRFKGAAT